MKAVRVDNGKYTFVQNDADPWVIKIQRHGEDWHRQEEASNALSTMMAELDAARVVIAAARALGGDAPREILKALERHCALVSDREKPSAWAEACEQDRP